MLKIGFSALLLLGSVLQVSVARAADLEPPPPTDELRPATYDWSGLFVSGWVGNACFNNGSLDDGTIPLELDGCGYKAGIGGGYNHQIQDFVVGVEMDYGWSGSKIEGDYDPTATGDDFNFSSVGTVRAKLGYAFDDTLLFITAGGAYANFNLTGQAGAGTRFDSDDSGWGWTIGGGIEHAVTDSFRLRLDYLYTDFATIDFACIDTCNPQVDPGSEHEVRLGAIWAFNWF